MNSEQLRLFINGAFGNEADARRVRRKLEPELRRVLAEIREIVEQLGDASLTRQRDWRALLELVEEALLPYNDALGIELGQQLPVSGLGAAEETTLQLKSVLPGIAGGLLPPEAVMADSTKFLLNTQVSGQRVLAMFAPSVVGGPTPFTKFARRRIDQLVTGGIIRGDETKVIASKLIPYLNKQLAGDALAIARTAIQDYNRQVKEAVWDANKDSFAEAGLAYEWVSALDSRTCPTCAPLDGEVKDKKSEFPLTPVHVNCRCQVVLVDPDDPGKIRYGQQAMVEKPTGDGAYKTKKVVKGEKLYRKNKEVKTVNGKSPRYADFLADSNLKTQQMFFGGGNAGSIRAERFRQSIKSGTPPQKALIDLTNRVDKTKKRTTLKGAARRFKPADAPSVVAPAVNKINQAEIDAVKKFTDFDFQAVSAAKYQQAKEAGKKLTEFEQSRANIYGSETDRQLSNRLERADLVDSYIAKKKPYKGSIYRGVNLDSKSELQELWNAMKDRGTLAPESWSESKEIGVQFAGKGDARVLFELVDNESGVSIKRISNKPKEREVLMPSGVRFEPIDMRTTEDGLTIIRVKEKKVVTKVESVTIDLRGDGTDHVVPMRDFSDIKYDVKKPLQSYKTQIVDGMALMQSKDAGVTSKLLADADKFTDSFSAATKSINTLDKASNAKTIAKAKETFIKSYGELGEVLKSGTAAASKYRDTLLTDIPQKTLDTIVKNVKIVGGTKAQQATAKKAIREFTQMFNGNGIGGIRKIKLDKLTDGGDFDIRTGMIRIGLEDLSNKDLKNLLFHEMGHSLEYSLSGLKDNAVAWRDSRATAKKPGRLGFGRTTFYRYVKDKFYDEYVGRIYDYNSANDATEVISTGIEMFARPDTMLELLSRDPEHFFLINSLTRQSYQP